jgi:rubrerythrin
LKNDVLDSEDVLVVHLAYADDFKNEEEFQQVKNKCPHHGVKGEVITVNEKLKKITVVCNPNSFIPQIDNSFEARLERMHDICPVCGTILIDGKCLSCGTRPYEN